MKKPVLTGFYNYQTGSRHYNTAKPKGQNGLYEIILAEAGIFNALQNCLYKNNNFMHIINIYSNMLLYIKFSSIKFSSALSHIKPEIDDVPVLHYIILALQAEFPLLPHFGYTA